MYHSNMRKHFKDTPKIFIEKQMKAILEIHRQNIDLLSIEVSEKLMKDNRI